MHLFGIDWVGVNAESGRKLLLSLIFIAAVLICSAVVRALVGFSRHIVGEFDRAGIGIASSTYDIVGLPPIMIQPPREAEQALDRSAAQSLPTNLLRWLGR